MFGSAIRSAGRHDAGTVKINADTGEFNAKIEQAERQWRESTAAMSRDALKLDLAQDRLRSSLARYGAESAQAKRATIALKDAEDAATRSTQRLDQAHDRHHRRLVSLRTAAVAAAGAIGVYGLTSAIRSFWNAASEQEMVLGQTQVALEAAGLSWDTYGDRVERALTRQSKALAFDDEALARSFQVFIRQTGNVDEALRRNELAADLARGRYMSLEQATQLVTKAALGQAGALRRVGIDTRGATTGVELLRLLTEKYGQSAERAATTSQAAQDRWNVSLENAKETLGTALLPAFTSYIGKLTQYVDKTSESGELQQKVNAILEDTEDIVSGVAKGMDTVRRVLGPIVEGLGGMERAAQTLFTVFAVSKLLRIAGAIRGIGAAATFSRTEIALLNSTPVTTGVAAAGAGRLAGLAGLLGPATLAGTLIATSYFYHSGKRSLQEEQWNQLTAAQQLQLLNSLPENERDFILNTVGWKLKSGPGPDPSSTKKGGRGGIQPGPVDHAPSGTTKPPAPRPTTTLPRGLGDAINLAALSPGLRDDLTAAGQVREFWAAQLKLAKKGTTIYSTILGELVSANRAVESIQDQLDAEQQRHDDALEEKRRKAAEARIAKAKAAAARRARDAEMISRVLSPGRYSNIGRPNEFNPAGQSPGSLTKADGGGTGKGLSPEDVNRQIFEFLVRFEELQRRYAGTDVRAARSVVVNQTFPAPTPDRNMEARFARFAMEAALSG